MKKEPLVFAEHMLESITKIKSFIKGISKEEFMSNEEKQSAVIRQIEIIGEASKNIPESFKKKYSKISWKEIAGTRDKIIHNYFGIDLDMIWDVVKEDLLILEQEIKKILEKEKEGNKYK